MNKEKIRDAYLRGASLHELARWTKTSIWYVKKHLDGIPIHVNKIKRKLSYEESLQMKQLLREGWTITALAQKYNVSRGTIYNELLRKSRKW